jgi:hypothetical protein
VSRHDRGACHGVLTRWRLPLGKSRWQGQSRLAGFVTSPAVNCWTCRHRDQLSSASCALGRRHNAASTTHTCTPHRKDCDRHTAAKTSPPTPSVPDTTRLTGSHAESSLAPAAPESAGNASASAPACLGATLDDSPAQAHTPQETPCRGSWLPTHDTGAGTDRHDHVQGHARTTGTLAGNAMHTDTPRPHLLPTALRLPQPPESQMATSEPPRS